MPKASQAIGDVADQRPFQPNLRHGSRGGSGITGLTPDAVMSHNQPEVVPEDLANIAPPTLDPAVNVDILRRSLL